MMSSEHTNTLEIWQPFSNSRIVSHLQLEGVPS